MKIQGRRRSESIDRQVARKTPLWQVCLFGAERRRFTCVRTRRDGPFPEALAWIDLPPIQLCMRLILVAVVGAERGSRSAMELLFLTRSVVADAKRSLDFATFYGRRRSRMAPSTGEYAMA